MSTENELAPVTVSFQLQKHMQGREKELNLHSSSGSKKRDKRFLSDKRGWHLLLVGYEGEKSVITSR